MSDWSSIAQALCQSLDRLTRAIEGLTAGRAVRTNNSALRVELSDGTLVDVQTSAPLTADAMDQVLEYMNIYAKWLKNAESSCVWEERKS